MCGTVPNVYSQISLLGGKLNLNGKVCFRSLFVVDSLVWRIRIILIRIRIQDVKKFVTDPDLG